MHEQKENRKKGDSSYDMMIVITFTQDPEGNYVRPTIVDNGDGTFTVTYTPEDIGNYQVKVKYGGKEVPKSPFKVKATPTGDASKVKIKGQCPSSTQATSTLCNLFLSFKNKDSSLSQI